VRSGIDIAYTIETSNWTGETFLQLSVQDGRSGQWPVVSDQQVERS